MRETQTQTGAANINNIKLEDAIRDHQQYEDEERERERVRATAMPFWPAIRPSVQTHRAHSKNVRDSFD